MELVVIASDPEQLDATLGLPIFGSCQTPRFMYDDDDLHDDHYDDRHLTPTSKKLTSTPTRCQPASCEKNRLVKLLTGLQKFRQDDVEV